MEAIENAAFVSVGRSSGFAGLAVFCLVFGLSYDPVLAARTGGTVCLIVTAVLCFYGLRARKRPYQHTELWLILPEDQRPPAEIAQQVVGEALHGAYLWFASQAVIISIVFLIASVGLQFIGAGRP